MDKKSIIGLVLIFLIIVGFGFLTRPSEEERERLQAERDSVARVMAERQAEAQAAALAAERARDSAAHQVAGNDTVDNPWRDARGSESVTPITLSNDLLVLSFSPVGGQPVAAQLKGYSTYSGDSLMLFREGEASFGFQFALSGRSVSTDRLGFQLDAAQSRLECNEPGDTATLVMRFAPDSASRIEYRYRLPYGSHRLSLDVRLFGLASQKTDRNNFVDLAWTLSSPQQERPGKKELENTLLSYHTPNGDFEQLSAREEAQELVTTNVDWVAFKQQFFSIVLQRKEGFVQSDLQHRASAKAGCIRDFSAKLMVPYEWREGETISLAMLMMPNHYKLLQDYGDELDELVPMGSLLVNWINRYVVVNVFDWLSGFISNYGLIILILTILVKIVVFPLTYRSYRSMAKMRVLKPMVDEISAKYPKQEDQMKKQAAVMDLYKRAGASPLGGCLPMLIQFPILIAMFRFFPASIELRQKSFLWASDLSSYDSILQLPFTIPYYGAHVSLFTLLMALSLYLLSLINFRQQQATSPTIPGMKFMSLYLMPIMMLFWFNDYSSGLSYYYLLANVITIGQTILIRRTVDEKALLAKLQKTASRSKKKSGFMARLEQMQREQQRKIDEQKRRR